MNGLDRTFIPDRRNFTTGMSNTAHHLGGIDGRPIFATRIHTLRRERQEPVLTHSQIMFRPQFRQEQFPRRAGIRRGFQHYHHALVHVLAQFLDGRHDERHIRVAGLTQRSGHTNTDSIHLLQHGEIRRSGQLSVFDKPCNRIRLNIRDIRLALQ